MLDWWQVHGRKNLPWQRDPTPYRVWVSEIMLQQTQVNTASGYYLAFMERFANVKALAMAEQEHVLVLMQQPLEAFPERTGALRQDPPSVGGPSPEPRLFCRQ